MSLITVGATPTTINQSGSDSVAFVGTGTLNVTGTAQNPITVSLSSVAGIGLLDTINISYADVTLGGTLGVSAIVAYNIGAGGTLHLQSTLGVALGSSITFTGARSHLVVNSGVNLNQLGNISIGGFGPGSNIDLAAIQFASYTYSDNAGNGTGGTLTLLDGSGTTIGSIVLTTGEFTAASFNVHLDGTGGTLVDFATYVSGISATPANGDLTTGATVAFQLATTGPVTITGGTPTLTLNDGGTATYDAVHSTATNLIFNYTVQPGQNTPDLAVSAVNLNGASASDALGSPVSLAGAVANPAGTLQIDTTPPTITSIATTPSSGALDAGQVVAITLTTSEAVTVAGGTPTLSLNDGGVATYDAAHSTATNLVFKYTVQAGQNTPNLAVTGSNLNGATITDPAGNAANLAGAIGSPAGTLQIDTTPPTIASISTTPASGAIAAGQVVAITLTPSEAVTVAGGTPTLMLNDGGVAVYDPTHSTATKLVFNYTVQAGDNTSQLAVTGSNLNGATITDPAGNAANLAGAVGSPPGTLQIDTTPPTITSISTSPGTGALAAGQIVAISLTPSEAVTVAGGTPTLTLNDGGIATYDAAHSTPTNLVFKYTVQPGDSAADLTVTGSSLNGATITDPAGNAANLAGAVGNPPGTLQIDATTPTFTSIATTPGSGALGAGQVVAITLTASEAVTVAGGTPTLTLNDGGTATYDAAHSTATNLVFKYTVQPGDNTPDLTVTGLNLNGATINNAAGTAANVASAVGNPPGTLQIDTTPPTITSIATTPGNGTVAPGQVVAFTLPASKAVTVAGGTPTLTLSDGGFATYDPASSTPTNLVFKYVVQPGDSAADLAVTGANLNGATITDAAGNAINLAGAAGNPPGTLKIDPTLPPVTSVYSVVTTPGSGDLGAGSSVAFQVTLTGNATVSGGTPTLTLSDGGTATYDAASSTATSLIFRHTVQPGQNTPDLAVTGTSLNGATVTDGSGNPVDLSGAVVNPSGTLQIDTTAPGIGTVTTTPGSGSFRAGQIITITVPTSKAVTVSGGTPALTLNDGGIATYDAVHSTSTNLLFSYTIQPGQNVADLTVTAVSLNGATIIDGAGNVLSLAGAVGNPAGILQIDTTAPTVTAVATQPANGIFDAGDVIPIDVTPSEAVSVTLTGGTPTLTLNDGGTASYDAAASTPTRMVFDYTVQAGQNTAALAITGSSLNGGAITDLAGNAIDLSGVVGTPPGGVVQINTVPVVKDVTVTPQHGDLNAGKTITLEVDMSGPVTITGGVPSLSLSDGGSAVYDASSSTPTSLVFRNTIVAGQNTPDLSVIAAFLNGATITDGNGRTVSLNGAIGNPDGVLQVDTIAPTVVTIVQGGSLQAGGLYTQTAYLSEAVTLLPGSGYTVQLSSGGHTTYDPTLSTPTMLVSTYRIPLGRDFTSADIVDLGVTIIGSVATDGAGNFLNAASFAAAAAAAQSSFNNNDASGSSTPTTIDVYRFFDTVTGTHFYTSDPTERQTILATRPDLTPEGPNGVGLTAVSPTASDPNASPVYRFFDLKQGTQFLTASATERDSLIATRPDLVFEPTSTFYEHTTQQAGDTAVYRFFDKTTGTHFYTDDVVERGVTLQTRPDLVQEGIGFYEPLRNPAS